MTAPKIKAPTAQSALNMALAFAGGVLIIKGFSYLVAKVPATNATIEKVKTVVEEVTPKV